MISNKDIHDCFDIAYSNTIDHSSIIRDYVEIKSDNDIGYKLLCNQKRKCYVLFVYFSESLLVTDFRNSITQFFNNTEKDIQFENGKCERRAYEKACEIMNKIAPKLGNFTINKFFCVGFYDGGSISSVIVTIIKHKYYKNIEYHNMFERFDNNIFGIVFAAFQTFSPEINESTRSYILNFSLENERCIDLNLKNTLPGTFCNLGTWTDEKDSFIKSFFKRKASYVLTSKRFLVQYQNAIREFVDDNDNIIDINVILMRCNSKAKTKNVVNPIANQNNENQQDSKKEIKKKTKLEPDNDKKETEKNKKIKDSKNKNKDQSSNLRNLSGDNNQLMTIEKETKSYSKHKKIKSENQEENIKSKEKQLNGDNSEIISKSIPTKEQNPYLEKEHQKNNQKLNQNESNVNKENAENNQKLNRKQNENDDKENAENNQKLNLKQNKNDDKENTENNQKLNLKQNENDDKENTENNQKLNRKQNENYDKENTENNQKLNLKQNENDDKENAENNQKLNLKQNENDDKENTENYQKQNESNDNKESTKNNQTSKFQTINENADLDNANESNNNHEQCKISSKIQNEKLSINENEKNITTPLNKDKAELKENMQSKNNKNKDAYPSTPKAFQYKDLRTRAKTLQPKSSNMQNEKQPNAEYEKQISSQQSKNKSKENKNLLTPNRYQYKELRQKSKTLQPKSSSKIQKEKQTETENEKQISKDNMQSQNKSKDIEPSTPKTFQYKNLRKHANTLQPKSSNISHSLSMTTKKHSFSNSDSFIFYNNAYDHETNSDDFTFTKSNLRKSITKCKTTQFRSYGYSNFGTPNKRIRPLIKHSKQYLEDARKYY